MSQDLYRMEVSGSLTPQLEGAPSSQRHEPRLALSPAPLSESPLIVTPHPEKGAVHESTELSAP